jgi:hypothetical protein
MPDANKNIRIPSIWKPQSRCSEDFDNDYRVIVIDLVYHQDKNTPMVVYVSLNSPTKWVEYLEEFVHLYEQVGDDCS